MRTFFFVVYLFGGGVAMGSQITVVAKDIQVERGGSVVFFLYSAEGFPKNHEKALEKKKLKATENRLSVEFERVPGEFAIKILHDEDEDGEVSKNWTGFIPREGLGFSNGQSLKLTGPPNFNACKLKLESAPNPVEIQIRYP